MGAILCRCRHQEGTTSAVAVTQPDENENEKNDDALFVGAFRYEDDEGSDLFFSARESLSQSLNELSYPPTSIRILGGQYSMKEPDSLLHHWSEEDKEETPTSTIENKDEPALATNTGKMYSSQRPTQKLKERLLSKEFGFATGYPGELSQEELEACLEFRRRLKEHENPTYRAMAYLHVSIDNDIGPEEEAFALCRFLRARDFDVDKTFAMMDEHVDVFGVILQTHNLHRSQQLVEGHVGCPLAIFTQQFPMADAGVAKNGSFVVYMKAGKIRLDDGFDCICDARTPKAFCDKLVPMAWYICCQTFCETMQRLKNEQQLDVSNNENEFAVLAEAVFVMDLQDVPRSLFTTRTMEFLQQAFGIIQCFPEILNRVVVVNVPRYFTFIWAVLKHFLDARTARKIGFFSSLEVAQPILDDLIDSSQLLADYGGEVTNPNFEEAVQAKLKRDGDYNRYIFEYYSSSSSKQQPEETLQTFALHESEVAELAVYTQATPNADGTFDSQFLLLLEDSNDTMMGFQGRSMSDQRANTSRFGQPAAILPDQSVVSGPGNFRLVVVTNRTRATSETASSIRSSMSGLGSSIMSSKAGTVDRALVVVSIR